MTGENKEWYVVNTYAGHENRVKENLERRMETMNLQDNLFQIIVAEVEEIDYKNGKEVKKKVNLFPGYLFVQMIMSDEAWFNVRNCPGVTGFIGSSGGGAKPLTVSEEEIENLMQQLGMIEKKVVVTFAVGDKVRILSGPFAGVEGKVESMNDKEQNATVLALMFGRETPTEIDYCDLEKIED